MPRAESVSPVILCADTEEARSKWMAAIRERVDALKDVGLHSYGTHAYAHAQVQACTPAHT